VRVRPPADGTPSRRWLARASMTFAGLAHAERPAQPPAEHPYLIMNPKSGGGKIGKFGLKRKEEELGAEVFLIEGPEPVNGADAARQAVTNGANLPGVAGGRRHAPPQ